MQVVLTIAKTMILSGLCASVKSIFRVVNECAVVFDMKTWILKNLKLLNSGYCNIFFLYLMLIINNHLRSRKQITLHTKSRVWWGDGRLPQLNRSFLSCAHKGWGRLSNFSLCACNTLVIVTSTASTGNFFVVFCGSSDQLCCFAECTSMAGQE